MGVRSYHFVAVPLDSAACNINPSLHMAEIRFNELGKPAEGHRMSTTQQYNPLALQLLARDRLNDEEMGILNDLASVTPKQMAIGDNLVLEGDSPTASCLMLSGYSARYHVLSDGKRNISAIHVPGDFVDLHSLLLQPMDHGVIALSAASVVMIPHTRLRGLTETHPHLSRMLWLSTLVDAAMHRRWLVASGRLSPVGRVAHLLCELFVRLRTVHQVDGNRFWLPMTQAQLSDAMGLSTVHINRTLQEMRKRGLIVWSGADVEILDWEALASAAEFDAGYLNLQTRAR